ncbi:TSL-kinase interacting protein 1-like isoform X1 [Zingiber officinale]|uniref:TSL-kinase interacting protein 1-like isoform X1 n=1 Tax=Zingiber officinale TaxID=94328 RepID=UPI001C4BB85A|nr:TSL-kinase interacting protein 1-like isoform X1 [Zingiber officinale]XP_042405287.1 TSL-kinase interacting protein 1-like isoform X1 [Zingiber officinale]
MTMKPSNHRKATTTSGTKDGLGCNNSDSIKVRKQKRKITGNSSFELGGQLLNSIQMNHMGNKGQQTNFVETLSEDLESLQRKHQDSYGKVKLQLFPIDEETKKMLEQGNLNPYLELTLTTRKKISSVVKHLNNKWGSSKFASGKLMLFPNNVCLDNLSDSSKWTLEDSNLTAADVHASLGSPAVFRLRYGWFNVDQTKQLASVALAGYDILRKNNYFDEENNDKVCSVSGKEHGQCHTDNSVNPTIQAPMSEKVIQNVGDQNNVKAINTSLIDCLSGMSFGAIFSEVSDAPVNLDPLDTQNLTLPQIPLTCDSFDAAISAFMHGHQYSHPSYRIAPPSILEAEETCHPFPFPKAAPSSQDIPISPPLVSPTMGCTNMLDSPVKQVSLADNCPAPATSPQLHDATVACVKPKSVLQRHSQDRLAEDLNAHAEFQAEVQLNESNQFGGMNLISTDSLGPLEIVAACPKERNDGETDQIIGLGGLIASSMDAFQNFSIV